MSACEHCVPREELTALIERIVDEKIEERLREEHASALSIPEAAGLLGVSERTAWRKARSGELRTARALGRVLVRRSEIDRLLEAS